MEDAQRWASGAASSRSEARAEAVRRRLHADVRQRVGSQLANVKPLFVKLEDFVGSFHILGETEK